MRICDIVQFHSPLSGGVKRYIGDKIRYLAAQPGVQHVVIVPGRENTMRIDQGARIYEIASPPLPGSRGYRILLSGRRLTRILLDERPDVIEVDDPYRSAWLALRAAHQMGASVVAFYHSDYPRALGRASCRFGGLRAARIPGAPIEAHLVRLYRGMDVTVAASRRVVELLRGLGLERVEHVPLGVDPEVFYPRDSRWPVRAELGIPSNAFLLVCVGRLAREKNIAAVIGMVREFSASDGPIHLLFVGDGELGGLVRHAARTRRGISWRPYCTDGSRLAEYYSAADLLVHAGTSETFGLVAVEAQACGTPVLAVRGGGLEETLEGEPRPLLVEAASSSALAEGVLRSRRTAPESQALRRARARRTIDRFSSQQTGRRLLALYVRLRTQRAGPGFVAPGPA